jgi:hypothetical protein
MCTICLMIYKSVDLIFYSNIVHKYDNDKYHIVMSFIWKLCITIVLLALGYLMASEVTAYLNDTPLVILDSPYVKDYDYKVSCSLISINDQLPLMPAKVGDVIHYRLAVTNTGSKDLNDITCQNSEFGFVKLADTITPGGCSIYEGAQTITQLDINGHSNRNDFICAVGDFGSKYCAYEVPFDNSSMNETKEFNKLHNGYEDVQPNNNYTSYQVCDPDGEIGGDYHNIMMYNRSTAKDPTYAEMIAFLWQDVSDQEPYITNYFVCADYAEQVQHNAAARNIRCAWVGIELVNETGHACNAFNTLDRGLIFVDCTRGSSIINHNDHNVWDTESIIEVGKPYKMINLYDAKSSWYEPRGTIKSYNITW